ncbi:MAG TPA: DUF2934 domain-containing protein [Terriglobales bacterium]|nr:DUF2934 domain-containing protein [Terriglobales bacterium]
MAKVRTPRSNGRAKQTPSEVQFESTSSGAAAAVAPALEAKRNVIPINIEEEIRRRAYELYQERGYADGHASDDWVRAEREVLARYGEQQSA